MQLNRSRLVLFLLLSFNPLMLADQCKEGLLLEMAAIGNIKAVKELLDDGVPIDTVSNYNNDTALHLAALKGHEAMVQLLLRRGATIDSTNSGITPLMYTLLYNNHPRIAEILLEHGASTTTLDAYGQTPLHIILWNDPKPHHHKLVELLLRQGAYVDIKNKVGLRPLELAIRKYQSTISRLLLNYDAELTEKQPMPDKMSTEEQEIWYAELIAMRNERLLILKKWHQHLIDQKQMPRDLANLVLRLTLPVSHIAKLHSLRRSRKPRSDQLGSTVFI